MRSLAIRRWNDLREALTTAPDSRTWLVCALVYALFLVAAAPIGLTSGLLRPTPPHLSVRDALVAGVLLLIQPALIEEIVFRGLLLPRDARTMSRSRLAIVALTALAVYVASHPLNAWLFRPNVLGLFMSPVYLVLATLLGLACTITYFISRSIWPPVAIHWLTVVTWIWFLGGQALLQSSVVSHQSSVTSRQSSVSSHQSSVSSRQSSVAVHQSSVTSHRLATDDW